MLWLIIVSVIFGIIGSAIGKNKEVGSGVGFLLGFLLSLVGVIILLCLKNKEDDYGYEYYTQPVQETASTPETQNITSTADELLKWHSLKEKGAITEEEFERMKNKLL